MVNIWQKRTNVRVIATFTEAARSLRSTVELCLIAGHGHFEIFGLNNVEAGEVGIEHHTLAADHVDLRGDAFDNDLVFRLRL